MIFGRKLAITTVKPKKNPDGSQPVIEELMTLDEIADLARSTLVGTVADIAGIVVLSAGALAVIKMTTHVVKTVYR